MTIRPPQVSDRVKEAPVRLLRAVFAGIGQLLLVVDRHRRERAATVPALAPSAIPQPRSPRGAAATSPAATSKVPEPAAPLAAKASAQAAPLSATKAPGQAVTAATVKIPGPARPAQATGSADAMQPGIGSARRPLRHPLEQPTHVRLIAPAQAAADDPAAPERTTAAASGRTTAGQAPVAGYDSWSLPSLRARLRTLNSAQVRALAEYERATTRRAEFLSMFERRLAKLGDAG